LAIGGGTGFHLRPSKDFELHVQPRRQELSPEAYFGAVNKYGLTSHHQADGHAVDRAVPMKTSRRGCAGRRLSRRQREVTATVGAGANLCVGGSSQLSLAPLSLQTQTTASTRIGVTSSSCAAPRTDQPACLREVSPKISLELNPG